MPILQVARRLDQGSQGRTPVNAREGGDSARREFPRISTQLLAESGVHLSEDINHFLKKYIS